MSKKPLLIFAPIIILIWIFVFYWQVSQKEIDELNKPLPEGIRVTKSLLGKEYTVINKIDGYQFKVPLEWNGIAKIEYLSKRTEEGFTGATIDVSGKEGGLVNGVAINSFSDPRMDNLDDWADKFIETFGFFGRKEKGEIGNIPFIKISHDPEFGPYIFFIQGDSNIYTFNGSSEDFIRYIIANGSW